MITRPKMNNYSVITEARVTTEYIVKAYNQEDAREKYYDGAVEEENKLDKETVVIDNTTWKLKKGNMVCLTKK